MREIEEGKLIRSKLAKGRESPLTAYIDLTAGEVGFARFLLYEILTFFLGPMPGGLGFYLRKKFYPTLFKKVGKGLIIGRNVVIRHPHKVELGDNVTIDDGCVLMESTVGNNCFLPFRSALYLTHVMENSIVAQNTCLQMCLR